ncbi:ribonuclease Y [Lentilactobacillus farraginis]|uniref:Ribonuclease Y n=1 Tax=Lentilactobacillus farraginis DSM 18382 = JCM 14108 TaxID=1423743 RepID=X0PK32_9LACO|nr:ribonuclease Y [Lentilactobacillus farraginis]KRM04640.1 2,3-cyclic-nucleotide 2-phosphodiesterase [Lentilactobacillus farraginis DSM 18382 = JCM 14108]GAF36966.1 hydrolase [Lentilactobacillus farraginis DSM 18382 = JCM 14108]
MLYVILGIIVCVVSAGSGVFLQKRRYAAKVDQARQTAAKLLERAKVKAQDDAEKINETANQQTSDYKESIEEELDSYQADNATREVRINQREAGLKQTAARLDQIHADLAGQSAKLADLKQSINTLHQQADELAKKRVATLEANGGMTSEQAKDQVISRLKQELAREEDIELRYQQDEAAVNAPKIAKIMAVDAIQRGPVDVPRERTEHVVQIYDNSTKKKLLGRDGQNIRYIETLTGTNLVFDPNDRATLHIVTADPIRREVAKLAITNLTVSKQINAQSIERQVEVAETDVMNDVRKTGERAVGSLHIGWMHPDLIKIVGRLKYRTSYGQNVLNHSIEVADIAGLLAAELGLNVRIAKRAGLLHDIGKAIDREINGTHVELGVKIAETFNESPQVINAIASHHGDVEVTTPIARLVAAGDSISGGRPGARSESVEEYINRLKSLERIASSKPGVKESYAIQAGREIRIMVDPRKINDQQNAELADQVKNQIEDELTYPGKIKVTAIRDFKAVTVVGMEKQKVGRGRVGQSRKKPHKRKVKRPRKRV